MPTVSSEDLPDQITTSLDALLADADTALARDFPGEAPGRQPVHTVYVPADRFTADLVPTWGREATAATDHPAYAQLVAPDLAARVRAKLATEPIEDLRIDFEDGYGDRPDQEDAHARAAAGALAAAQADGTAPARHGIRFKCLESPTRARGVRTLWLFLDHLLSVGGGLDAFVVTLPKVTSVDQVFAMVEACRRLESGLGLDERTLGFELQIETPQSILGSDGTALVARMIHASDGRCRGLHYGTYDYSAFCGIAAPYQSLEHPAADHAKAVMQAAAAGTGIRLSDGSTNVLPIGDPVQVRAGWELHLRLVRRSLERGFYQGWDLHPAQLPTRFAATYAFYLDGFEQAASRLRRYVAHEPGSVLDEPATARALSSYVVRALDCGAVSVSEATAATGLTASDLAGLARPTGR
jgi:citrate lyase beta subunit